MYWKIKWARLLPITFLNPISLSLRDEIAIEVLVKLKHAINKIIMPLTAEPITAEMGGAPQVLERVSFDLSRCAIVVNGSNTSSFI